MDDPAAVFDALGAPGAFHRFRIEQEWSPFDSAPLLGLALIAESEGNTPLARTYRLEAERLQSGVFDYPRKQKVPSQAKENGKELGAASQDCGDEQALEEEEVAAPLFEVPPILKQCFALAILVLIVVVLITGVVQSLAHEQFQKLPAATVPATNAPAESLNQSVSPIPSAVGSDPGEYSGPREFAGMIQQVPTDGKFTIDLPDRFPQSAKVSHSTGFDRYEWSDPKNRDYDLIVDINPTGKPPTEDSEWQKASSLAARLATAHKGNFVMGSMKREYNGVLWDFSLSAKGQVAHKMIYYTALGPKFESAITLTFPEADLKTGRESTKAIVESFRAMKTLN